MAVSARGTRLRRANTLEGAFPENLSPDSGDERV